MACGPFTIFSRNNKIIKMTDLTAGSVYLMLCDSSFTPDFGSSGTYLLSEAVGDEISGTNGYVTGGGILTGKVVSAITDGYSFTSDTVTFTATGAGIAAWRWAVMYYSGTLEGVLNPLIGAYLADSTPADAPITLNGMVLVLSPSANGWYKDIKV